METAHKRIWLQCSDDTDCPVDDRTWCQDKVYDADVEYVRADVAGAEIERLRGALLTGASLLEQWCNTQDLAASMRRVLEVPNAMGSEERETAEKIWNEITQSKARIAELELRMAIKYEAIVQAITDPENQPSQFGTVTLAWHEARILDDK